MRFLVRRSGLPSVEIIADHQCFATLARRIEAGFAIGRFGPDEPVAKKVTPQAHRNLQSPGIGWLVRITRGEMLSSDAVRRKCPIRATLWLLCDFETAVVLRQAPSRATLGSKWRRFPIALHRTICLKTNHFSVPTRVGGGLRSPSTVFLTNPLIKHYFITETAAFWMGCSQIARQHGNPPFLAYCQWHSRQTRCGIYSKLLRQPRAAFA